MKRPVQLLALASLLLGCGTIPDRMSAPSPFQKAACDEMLSAPWIPSSPPWNASRLLEMPQFHPWERGIVWYSVSPDRVAACAFTSDPDGCGYTTHEFVRLGERWYYSPGPSLERICVVG